MPIANVNDIEIFYDTAGDQADPAALLIHGYGAQIIQWPTELIDALTSRGLFVITFDNRDVGLSSKFDGQLPAYGLTDDGQPTVVGDPPYSLLDMARDGVGLLDHLGVQAAHVVGVSLGGAVAQRMAIAFGDRCLSLTSIMSTTGDRSLPSATPEASAALFSLAPTEREAFIEHSVGVTRTIFGPLFQEAYSRDTHARRFDRSFYPEGTMRQLAALMVDGDRTEGLRGVTCPSLVIHGRHDLLLPVENAAATADALGARLVLMDDLGHGLPPERCADIADLIAEVAGAPAGTSR